MQSLHVSTADQAFSNFLPILGIVLEYSCPEKRVLFFSPMALGGLPDAACPTSGVNEGGGVHALVLVVVHRLIFTILNLWKLALGGPKTHGMNKW